MSEEARETRFGHPRYNIAYCDCRGVCRRPVSTMIKNNMWTYNHRRVVRKNGDDNIVEYGRHTNDKQLKIPRIPTSCIVNDLNAQSNVQTQQRRSDPTTIWAPALHCTGVDVTLLTSTVSAKRLLFRIFNGTYARDASTRSPFLNITQQYIIVVGSAIGFPNFLVCDRPPRRDDDGGLRLSPRRATTLLCYAHDVILF